MIIENLAFDVKTVGLDEHIQLFEDCGQADHQKTVEYLRLLMSEKFSIKNKLRSQLSDAQSATEDAGSGGFALVYRLSIGDEELAVKVTSFRKSYFYEDFRYDAPLNMAVWEENKAVFTREARIVARGSALAPEASGAPLIFELKNGDAVYDYLLCLPMEVYEPFNMFVEEERTEKREREALAFANEVLTGLKTMHKTFVHRDIKPSNIMKDGKRYVLVDWGLAKEREKPDTMITLGGNPVDDGDTKTISKRKPRLPDSGHYTYSRKEEIDGVPTYESEVKGDLYSLGVVLAEIVCGSPLVAEVENPAEGYYYQQCIERINEFDSDICSEKFKKFLLKAVAEDGYQTASDMQKALANFNPSASCIFTDWEQKPAMVKATLLRSVASVAVVLLVSWFASTLGTSPVPETMGSNLPVVGVFAALFFAVCWLCNRFELELPRAELRILGLIWLLSIGAFAAVVIKEQQDLPVLIPLLAAGLSTGIYGLMKRSFASLSIKIGALGGRAVIWSLFGAVVGACYGVSDVAVSAVRVGKAEMLWAWDLIFPFLIYGVIGATLFFVLYAGRELWRVFRGEF